MPQWYAKPMDDWLAVSELYPEEYIEQKGATEEPGLRTLRGRMNRVQLGVPQTIDVLATWPSNERLEAEIEASSDRFDFYCVRLACSFVPDRGCQFTYARLDIKLTGLSIEASSQPIAVDLFPRDVGIERTFSRSFGLTGGLSLSFAELSIEGKQEEDVIHYKPSLTGAGLLTESPNWTFTSGGSGGLIGITELFLLVKKWKGVEVTIQFALGAEVQTAWGLLRYSNERLLEMAYPLAV